MEDEPEQPLRILLVEDVPSDAELIESELRDADLAFVSQRVDTREAFMRALEEFHPDIVLSDYKLPAFDGGSALRIVREHYPTVPVVMVTGAMGDEKATELLKLGARDYVLKEQLARLAPAVQRALSEEQGIRARKAAEKALRESEARYQTIMQTANDAIICLRPDGTIHLWNHKAEELFGYSATEAVGLNLHQLIVPERFREKAAAGLRQFIKSGTGPVVRKTLELAAWRRDQTEFPIELSISPMNINGEWHATGIIRDITERKQAEQALRESEDLYHSLFENMLNGFAYCQMIFEQGQPQDFIYLNVNTAFETSTGLRNVVGKRVSEIIPGIRQSDPGLFDIYGRVSLSGKPEQFEMFVKALQQWFWISVYSPEKGYFVAVFDVITERKRNEQALIKLNRAFRTLSAGNHELVHASDEVQLLQAMCRVIVEAGGYRAAWVGYKQDDAEQAVRPMAEHGFDAGFVEAMHITWADREHGQGITGKAVRSGITQIMQDIVNNPEYAPWREQALQQGYASGIALPLRNNSEVFGSLSIFAKDMNAFDPEEVELLEEMAGDLAFGIRTLRLRQEQQRNATQVRKGLEGTIQAIAGMVEMRDPYTAGHQQRMAQLAAAIAVEMGLPEAQIHGIHLAGTIHDLGKIQTPAEILSKPGKLSATEYSLIKEHPQNGYEILKDIEFPWPIAQMVWQHHERLDGSGYPQGLKGDEILLEARILAVADVVEAMSSHRPYRPGLGIDAALAEIIRGRDTHYEPDAVDVCVQLFREKGFEFA